MKIYEFKDYDEYVEQQTIHNKKKLDWVFAREEVIKKLCELKPDAQNVMCHGTRNGAEQWYWECGLKKKEKMVIGTEISDTADDFPMTIQWDFQKPKDEWLNKFDVVYSNSFDHAIYPEECLQTWIGQLKQNGTLFLEYSEQQSVCQASDPLDASLSEIIELVKKAGFHNVKLVENLRGKNNSVVIQGEKR